MTAAERSNYLLDYIEEEWDDPELLAKVESHMEKHGYDAEAALDEEGIGTCVFCNDPVRPDDDADSGHGTIHQHCAFPWG